ncbi:MAG: SBBP repeat-containing protein, partial [bacterium]
NQGQAHEDVRFVARGPGYSLYLTAGEAVLVLAKPNPDEKRKHSAPERLDKRAAQAPSETQSVALRMALVGARSKPAASGLEELPGKANYFVGKDPSKWRTNVPTYAKVHYREVYRGIDLVYYGNQRQLEYDFIVAPGADPKKIVLGFKGADKLEIDAQGDLILHAAGGAIHQKRPVIYQEVDGLRQEIAGSYVRKGAKRVGFKVAAYDTSRPLIIDPVVLAYSTYLGGSGEDLGNGIAVDAAGNAYITGSTSSTDFPTTPGTLQTALGGCSDAFVTNLDPTGSTLVYSTFLGGSDRDGGLGIAVDAVGNAYVTGQTQSLNFPTTEGAFQTTGQAVFVTKLDPTGSTLVYSTVGIGGSGVAVDADGNAYVGGVTGGAYPTTPGAFQTKLAGVNDIDVYVTKLNPAGSALVYSTYLGGTEFESFGGIAVDAAGNAYVTGTTWSGNFPTTPGAFQLLIGGIQDAFVTKLHSTGSALIYSTRLGGSKGESGGGIAVDVEGNAYVTGATDSSDFPTTEEAFDTTFNGGLDAFVTKLHSSGSLLIYSTYLGGIDFDRGRKIAIDRAGNAYATGPTNSLNFPTTAGAFQSSHAGGHGDAYVTKLNPAGSALVYST